jgi:hypothetical protein
VAENNSRDPDVQQLLELIEGKENDLKISERTIRKERDYRHVLVYFTVISTMRKVERDGRNYLINEVETLRARLKHQEVSMKMMVDQIRELEERYAFLHDHTSGKWAIQETLAEQYFDDWSKMLLEEHVVEETLHKERGRNNVVEAELTEQLATTTGLLANATGALTDTKEFLEFETSRANKAEAELKELRERYAGLEKMHVETTAYQEVQADMFFDMHSNVLVEKRLIEQRVSRISSTLFGMMDSSEPEIEQTAAVALEALQILTREQVMELSERIQMEHEELVTYTHDAVESSKGANKKKGGGKGGGGAKKGKGKKG